MSDQKVISLITDFGFDSPFVGVMKAVIISRSPEIHIVDLFHNVAAYNVDEGGFWLTHSYHYLPKGSIHIAIVDPGVGSVRRILAARYDGHIFLAPDNGLLHQAFGGQQDIEYRELDLPRLSDLLGLPLASATFHGRDIFAPVAAALAAGVCEFEELGNTYSDVTPARIGQVIKIGNEINGAVMSIDHYGNIITNIRGKLLDGHENCTVECSGHRFTIKRTYSDARAGEDIALVNSFGVLEIARAQGRAADRLGVNRGAKVTVRFNKT
ncbi:MAG: SAM-dependent chlorinase/fluorinase [Gammaproteobacteria bacterium]|nr:SAM-dependent chlorinase/fluorinase [Gammaproteobacteria bacterium]